MVLTSSIMLPLGTPLPSFELAVVSRKQDLSNSRQMPNAFLGSKNLSEKPLLLMVICAHCPFVKHLELGLRSLEKDYFEDIEIIAISSNSVITHPQDSAEHLAVQAHRQGWTFPYLLDSDQTFAKALKAACTPEFFVFSSSEAGQKILRYRGQFDSSRPSNDLPVTGKDLRSALDAVLEGKMVCTDQKPSIGCNIKWHPGQEPNWFG